jgi:formate dehydrogenase subunit gamma
MNTSIPITAAPAANSVNAADAAAAVQRALAQHAHRPGALLPVLHAVQDELGHVPAPCVPQIAQALNLSRAEVHGVLTYYHFFRATPAGRHRVQVCRAEACQACGAEDLLAQAEALLGCQRHETRADGAVSVEPVYCLGLCASSPAIQIDDRLHARVTAQSLNRLVAELALNR